MNISMKKIKQIDNYEKMIETKKPWVAIND